MKYIFKISQNHKLTEGAERSVHPPGAGSLQIPRLQTAHKNKGACAKRRCRGGTHRPNRISVTAHQAVEDTL